jgi:hypothetical protein
MPSFDLDDPRPRVGYVGDSVTFGVGAGYGYRMTEVLEEFYPDRQHMNLSWGLGTGMTPTTASAVLANVEALGLDTLVYVLNDILPGQDDSPMTPSTFRRLKDRLASLDVLRGNSYLYTWVRNELKTLLLSYGIGAEGRSYELHPETYQDVIEDTAARVIRLGAELAKRGVDFVVVILPYEMQISAQAEDVYRDLGVRWGEGFIERHTQKLLAEHLSGVRLADAAGAFLDPRANASPTSRSANTSCTTGAAGSTGTIRIERVTGASPSSWWTQGSSLSRCAPSSRMKTRSGRSRFPWATTAASQARASGLHETQPRTEPTVTATGPGSAVPPGLPCRPLETMPLNGGWGEQRDLNP